MSATKQQSIRILSEEAGKKQKVNQQEKNRIILGSSIGYSLQSVVPFWFNTVILYSLRDGL